MTIRGPRGIKPHDTQMKTAMNLNAVFRLRDQTLDCLRNGRMEELRGILKNFIESDQLGNLARNYDRIIASDEIKSVHSLPKLLRLLREVVGKDFHLLFAEFSDETQAKVVGQFRNEKNGIESRAEVLWNLLLEAEGMPAERKFAAAAAQLISVKVLYYLLNHYNVQGGKEKALSMAYVVKYRGAAEIGPVISRALREYSQCGLQTTRREADALEAFKRIMAGFRDLSIEVAVRAADPRDPTLA